MTTKEYIITTEQIEIIKKLLLNRNSYKEIKDILEELDNSKLDDVLKDLKELLHKGKRSQIHEFDIRDIINKYGENKDENKN